MIHAVHLKARRDRPVRRKHPWIFSGAIDSIDGQPQAGESVDIFSAEGEWLARGAYSPDSQIRLRIWTWDRAEQIDESFFHARIAAARNIRVRLNEDPSITAYREIYAESDLLPGLIVDRYGAYLVIQCLSQGIERHRDLIVDLLSQREGLEGIFERSDSDARSLEGLEQRVGVCWGSQPPDGIRFQEGEYRFSADIRNGHKTGFYLDQRENRLRCRRWIAGDVLDAFCYSGAFSVTALSAGANSVVSIDSSSQAIALTLDHLALNGFQQARTELVEDDVFHFLRSCRDSRRRFDTIILDPPKFASTSAHVERAARGYKDINLLAFKLLRPGGVLITFSCSGGIQPELFEKIIRDAALDAQVEVHVLTNLGQAEDHPVRLNFPEGRYLKGMVCRIHR